MKKTFLLIIAMIATAGKALACTVCRTQQPKLLQGLTHGGGPDDNWDYLIIALAVAIVLGTLAYSIKFILRPGENDEDHIKRRIINPQNV